MDEFKNIVIFTDGASRGNPGPGGWAAIICFDRKETVEIGGKEEHTTNNRMELTAVKEGLLFIQNQVQNRPVYIYTDSDYVVRGITKWIYGWQKNGWRTSQDKEVLNIDLWKPLFQLSTETSPLWKHVSGHRGVSGNERADEIATEFANKGSTDLYKGPLSKYPIDLFNFDTDSKKKKTKKKAYSYVSFVDGRLKTHSTWPECEREIRGKKGVRCKKANSPEDEKEIKQYFLQLKKGR